MGQWLQVDLRNPVQVVAVVTQGLSYSGPSVHYVRSYKISYCNNTNTQQFIRGGNGADLVICRYFLETSYLGRRERGLQYYSIFFFDFVC